MVNQWKKSFFPVLPPEFGWRDEKGGRGSCRNCLYRISLTKKFTHTFIFVHSIRLIRPHFQIRSNNSCPFVSMSCVQLVRRFGRVWFVWFSDKIATLSIVIIKLLENKRFEQGLEAEFEFADNRGGAIETRMAEKCFSRSVCLEMPRAGSV